MITIRLMGGLGNQLFQYATAYAIAMQNSQELRLDTTFFPEQSLRGYKLGDLNIRYHSITSDFSSLCRLYKNRYINKGLRKIKLFKLPLGKESYYILETKSDLIEAVFKISSEDVYLDGYYQSEKYFKQYHKDLLKQFQPNYAPEAEYLDVLKEIEGTNSVAVHVRRGDFLKVQFSNNPNQYLLGEQYYHNGLKYMDEHVESPVYYWFSDDIDWVKQNFGERENFRFVSLKTKHADIDEMMLMKNCHHIITANSTFSWWAAWLNEHDDAIHVCPAKRYGNLHMIPDSWEKIPVE